MQCCENTGVLQEEERSCSLITPHSCSHSSYVHTCMTHIMQERQKGRGGPSAKAGPLIICCFLSGLTEFMATQWLIDNKAIFNLRLNVKARLKKYYLRFHRDRLESGRIVQSQQWVILISQYWFWYMWNAASRHVFLCNLIWPVPNDKYSIHIF